MRANEAISREFLLPPPLPLPRIRPIVLIPSSLARRTMPHALHIHKYNAHAKGGASG